MSRRLKILGGVFCVVLCFLLARRWLNPLPRYDGQDIESWFRQYYQSGPYSSSQDPEKKQSAVLAFRSLGTNAVPFLLEECFSTYQDTALGSNVARVLTELPEPFRAPPFVPADLIRESATELLGEIRPPAGLILARATNALAGTNPPPRYTATLLLGVVGANPELVTPFLRPILSGSDFQQRNFAIQAILELGEGARDLLPDLFPLLTNSAAVPGLGRWQNWALTRAVAGMGSNAAPAIPILSQKFLAETNSELRLQLAVALFRIDPDQRAPLLDLVDQCRRERALALAQTNSKSAAPQPAMVQRLAWVLGDLGTNGQAVVPFLVELLDEDKNNLWSVAVASLIKIRPPREVVIPALVRKLNETDPGLRFNVASRLLEIDRSNPQAINALADLVKSNPQWEPLALRELQKLGPVASAALPALREAAARVGPWRQLAARTLKQVESK
jgi:hypothetical protein